MQEEVTKASKNTNVVSDEEVNLKAQAIANLMAKDISVQVSKERSDLIDQIEQLKIELQMIKKIMQDRQIEFEQEKVDLSDKIKMETNNTKNKGSESKQEMEKLESQINNLKKDLKVAETSIGEKNNALKKKDAEIQFLETCRKDQEVQISQLQSGVTVESKELQERIKSLENEKRKLLFEKSDLDRSKDEAQFSINKLKAEQLDVETSLRDKIRDLESENKMIKRGFEEDINEEKIKADQLRDQFLELKKEKDSLGRIKNKLEEKISIFEKQMSDFNTFKDTLIVTAKKMLKHFEPVESNLSCLSCLEFLEDPLMLICGHSICLKCFKTHSDPNSKDSIVFCEECKVETKNKELMESKVIEILCDKFKVTKKSVNEILNYCNDLKID